MNTKLPFRGNVILAWSLRGHKTALELLNARKWRLYWAGEDQGKFVTADQPVSLTWSVPSEIPPVYRHSPGLGMIDTEVLFPLTKDCLLRGRFDDMEEGEEMALAGFIARCNTRVIGKARNFVFAANKEFPYCLPSGELFWDECFLERAAPFLGR
ncbi:MAG: DUF4238 domain-containing protein [Rhodoferax sp.]|nr:DUF4238 domain-containing protein [Rhodoferax sp.]